MTRAYSHADKNTHACSGEVLLDMHSSQIRIQRLENVFNGSEISMARINISIVTAYFDNIACHVRKKSLAVYIHAQATRASADMYTYIHTYIHTRAHIHIHMRIHIRMY